MRELPTPELVADVRNYLKDVKYASALGVLEGLHLSPNKTDLVRISLGYLEWAKQAYSIYGICGVHIQVYSLTDKGRYAAKTHDTEKQDEKTGLEILVAP